MSRIQDQAARDALVNITVQIVEVLQRAGLTTMRKFLQRLA